MSNATNTRILAKLQHLAAMANDKSSENEAMIATRQLHALLAKHNMTLESLEGHDEEAVDRENVTEKDRPWKRLVANKIAQLYFCKFYYTSLGNGKSLYYFVGTEANRAFAMHIFTMVTKSVERDGRAESRKLYGKKVSSFVNSFRTGAMERICFRCDELIKAAKEGSLQDEEGTTLPAMLSTYDNAMTKVDDFLAANANLKTKSARTQAKDAAGYSKGQEAGNRAQLSRSLQSKNSTKLIGN